MVKGTDLRGEDSIVLGGNTRRLQLWVLKGEMTVVVHGGGKTTMVEGTVGCS